MMTIIDLDDLAYDLILSHLVYIDRFNLSLTCRTLRLVVQNSPQQTLNCTLLSTVPIDMLPFAADHHLVDHATWRSLKYSRGSRWDDLYLSRLCWNSRHVHFNEVSLRQVILDGTKVNVLDVIHFLTAAPQLSYLSVRFCIQVNRLLLQNFLDSTAEKRHRLHLKRLDVLGIDGLSFFEPLNNGSTWTFDETEIELIGAGPEYDYLDLWRETMYDFKMSLERVATWHGNKIQTDVARCSQAYCRNFDVGRRELADPTIESTLPSCFLCHQRWTIPICRACIAARSCNICETFICPHCYNIDDEVELHDFGTAQRWMQSMTSDLARGGIQALRDCKSDMRFSAMRGAIKACLMMQAAHRHQAPLEAANASLRRGWNC